MGHLLESVKPLIIKTIFFALAIGVVTAVLKYLNIIPAISNYWYWILIFYCAMTVAIFYLLVRALRKNSRKFVAAFFSVSLGRMLLFTGIILLYAVFVKTEAVGFILTFASYYILFTFWEVLLILPVVKRNKFPATN